LSRSYERDTGSIWLARQVGTWATRTFVFMAGIAATMIIGYIIIPALHWLVLPISLVLFAAGAICSVIGSSGLFSSFWRDGARTGRSEAQLKAIVA
jgi:hypothetical protein